MNGSDKRPAILWRIRAILIFFVVALIASGVTAIPL